MSFISAIVRNVIRQECKQRFCLKFVRSLSTASEEPLSGKTEDTRRYIPRSVFHGVYVL